MLDGAFDLGEFGAKVRQMGMFAFVVAVLVVNSVAFSTLRDHFAFGVLRTAKACVGG